MKEVYDALDAWVGDAVAGLHVSTVGRVESYDAAKQRAEVQPMIRRGVVLADGTRTTELHPIITDVPVVFPGSGGYSITWPIAKGDTVLLVFADQSLDRWLPRGDIVDPADDRSHTLTDAIAIPGIRPFSAPVSGAPSAAGGAMAIQAPGEIQAGGTDALALKAAIDALRTGIATASISLGAGGAAAINTAADAAVAGGGSWNKGTTKLKGG